MCPIPVLWKRTRKSSILVWANFYSNSAPSLGRPFGVLSPTLSSLVCGLFIVRTHECARQPKIDSFQLKPKKVSAFCVELWWTGFLRSTTTGPRLFSRFGSISFLVLLKLKEAAILVNSSTLLEDPFWNRLIWISAERKKNFEHWQHQQTLN